jgi:hypothetical protein
MPDVRLDSDDVVLVIGGEEVRAPCQVVLRPEPAGPEVTFRVSVVRPDLGLRIWLGSVSIFSLRFVKADVQADSFCHGGGADVLEFRPCRDPVVVGRAEGLAYVRLSCSTSQTSILARARIGWMLRERNGMSRFARHGTLRTSKRCGLRFIG